jgi:hypothetical protein
MTKMVLTTKNNVFESFRHTRLYSEFINVSLQDNELLHSLLRIFFVSNNTSGVKLAIHQSIFARNTTSNTT